MTSTSIFSSMSCLAWSICCGDPRMIKSLKLGSPLGGGCREISTNAPVCWLMDLTFSPPLPITSPHFWAGIEKVISPPGGPQPPCPPPRPLLPEGIPGGPGGPCGQLYHITSHMSSTSKPLVILPHPTMLKNKKNKAKHLIYPNIYGRYDVRPSSIDLWCFRGWQLIRTPCPSSLTRMLCSRSLMIWAACSQRSGGPLMCAILSGPVPSSGRDLKVH